MVTCYIIMDTTVCEKCCAKVLEDQNYIPKANLWGTVHIRSG